MSDRTSRLRAWWQLARAGNALTAVSNVIAGYCLAQYSWQPSTVMWLLVAASVLLYEAGMLLNDAFDAQMDSLERPERPIPSGRITRRTAAIAGWSLLFAGIGAAMFASGLVANSRPMLISLLLALCIIGYDVGLKATLLGPWTMGACRMLNVLLGAAAVGGDWLIDTFWYASTVGLYTVGLTYYARSENQSGRTLGQVAGGAIVCGTAVCLAFWAARGLGSPGLALVVFCLLNLFIWGDQGWVAPPPLSPTTHRGRVSRMILAFILLDALVLYAFVGWQPALVVLSLFVPTWIVGRLVPMT